MRRSSRTGAVVTAILAVGLLATGGAGVAGAVTPSAAVPPTAPAYHPGPPTVSGTVVSVATTSFRLALGFGPTLTVATTAATTYAETGAVVPPTGVAAGEQVTVTLTIGVPWWMHTLTATSVLVVLPHVIGTVLSVGTGSFALQLDGGLVLPVETTATTAYRMSGTKQSGVVAGQAITAYGPLDPTDPARLVALFVVISPPTGPTTPPAGGLVSGTVTSVGPPGFTMSGTGGSVTVTTSTATAYGETGAPSGPGGVAVGEQVRVTPVPGTPPTPTAVDAARVVVVLTQVTGTVRSIHSGGLTLTLFGGLVVTVDTNGSTVFARDGVPTPCVFIGEKVTAYGNADLTSPEQLDAQFVDADHPHGQFGHGDGDNDGDDGDGG
jgi:hypothetical protein